MLAGKKEVTSAARAGAGVGLSKLTTAGKSF